MLPNHPGACKHRWLDFSLEVRILIVEVLVGPEHVHPVASGWRCWSAGVHTLRTTVTLIETSRKIGAPRQCSPLVWWLPSTTSCIEPCREGPPARRAECTGCMAGARLLCEQHLEGGTCLPCVLRASGDRRRSELAQAVCVCVGGGDGRLHCPREGDGFCQQLSRPVDKSVSVFLQSHI